MMGELVGSELKPLELAARTTDVSSSEAGGAPTVCPSESTASRLTGAPRCSTTESRSLRCEEAEGAGFGDGEKCSRSELPRCSPIVRLMVAPGPLALTELSS